MEKKKAAPKKTKVNVEKSKDIKKVVKKETKVEVKKVVKKTGVKKNIGNVKVPQEFFYGTGKRKSAIAKVWMFAGSGKIVINNVEAINYLKSDILYKNILKPLAKISLDGKYDCKISVTGGGLVGQSDACRLGIARAILKLNLEFRAALKAASFLTRDPRVKERKKYGLRKARKGPQYRKR
jgi:small subunit ribosomal protein S9